MASEKPDMTSSNAVADPTGIEVRVPKGAPPWLACDLEVTSVAEIVGLLVGAKRTGRFDVVDPLGKRSLFFENGEYTGSSSMHAADRLGEVLWRADKISADQLVIAGEMLKEGKMLGRALVELGFIEPAALRRALVDQAIQVFAAACLEEQGHALFVADQFHKHPLRFGVATKKLVDDAIKRAREHRERARKLGSLDRPCDVVSPAPATALDEKALAVIQLAASARGKAMTGRDLIAKAKLGRLDGVRTLLALVEGGFLSPRDSVADEELKIKRLCAAINLVMAALDDGGFGVGDQVREYLDKPPPVFEEALAGLSLAEPLEETAVLARAKQIGSGRMAMIRALQAVLDDAMLQAGDTLSPDLTKRVLERVKALGV